MPSPKRRAFYLNPVKYQTPNASGNASKRPRRENPEVYRMAVGSERKRSPEIIELLDTKDLNPMIIRSRIYAIVSCLANA